MEKNTAPNKKVSSFKKNVIFKKDGHHFDWLSVSDEDILSRENGRSRGEAICVVVGRRGTAVRGELCISV